MSVSLPVFQVFGPVRAAEAASSRAAADPAVPHLTELHSSNDTLYSTLSLFLTGIPIIYIFCDDDLEYFGHKYSNG